MTRGTIAFIAGLASLAVPGAAGAATVGAEPDTRLVYRAAGGETNVLTVRPATTGTYPWASALLFDEASAPLVPLLGCIAGDPVACERRQDVKAFLGDRSDRADQRVGSASGSHVFGQTGDDDIFSSGGLATADGGAGDDRIQLSAAGDAVGYGGRGADTMTARATFFAVVHGGDGPDSLSAEGSNVRLFGGPGGDVISGFATLGGVGGIVQAGRGADRITAAGDALPWRISCGPGLDSVTARPDDVVASDCETVRRTSASRGRSGRPVAAR